jgi:hypothetical protein
MKLIPLRDGATFNSRAILAQVAGVSTQRALSVEEIRRRVRILDALDASADHLLLEDADHAALTEALAGFPFAVAHRELLQIIDDVLDARTPA